MNTAPWIRFLLAAAGAISLTAQNASSPAASIDVEASPRLVRLGGKTTLRGRSGIDHPSRLVRLTVKAQDGSSSELSVKAAENGDYSIEYATTTDGDHVVEAWTPGRQDRAETRFTVVGQNDQEEEIATKFTEIIRTAQTAVQTLETYLRSLPVSPAKQEALARLKPLQEKVAKLPAEAGAIKKAMAEFQNVVRTSPGLGPVVYQSVFNPLSEWHARANEHQRRLDRELAAKTRANARCDALHQLNEVLQMLSMALNLAGEPMAIMADFSKDYLSKKYSSFEKDPKRALATQTIFKSVTDLLGGPMGVFKIGLDASVDYGSFLAQQYFGRYCEKFEGPVVATVHAEYLHNGTAWRKFNQKITGKLTVRYAAQEQHQRGPIPVTGEFVGRAVVFNSWDDAIPVLFKNLRNRALIFRRTVLPTLEAAASELLDSNGQTATALGPGGFRIPVEGELVGETLRLRILPAAKDIDKVTARIICFVGGIDTLGVYKNNYELAFQGAHQILSAAVSSRTPQDVFELDVVVNREKRALTIDREFNGTRGSKTGSAYAEYKLSVKASNP